MKSLERHLEEFLDARRALGFKTARSRWLLSDFVSFARARRCTVISTELAVAWARRPAGAHPGWWAAKLSALRVFARHIHLVDPRHAIPPTDLIPETTPRSTPELFSTADVRAILRAARSCCGSRLRCRTYETIFGLLAATGMRVGEAIRLDCEDIDWREGVLAIHESKFRKSREVALHPTVVRALRGYAAERNRHHPRPASAAFFVSLNGTRLIYNNVHHQFAALLRRAGIKRDRARLHDLRHTFAVETILRWHRDGRDVDAWMPRLSTYLGHRDPSSTYWYLTASPELLALVGGKLERTLGVLS